MDQTLGRALSMCERLAALSLIVWTVRYLPSWPFVALLVLCYVAFRRSVLFEAAFRVAESLAEGRRAVPPLSLRDLVVDVTSIVAVALGTAAIPAVWAYAPLAAGVVLLAYNAPLRAAARLHDSLDRHGRGGQSRSS